MLLLRRKSQLPVRTICAGWVGDVADGPALHSHQAEQLSSRDRLIEERKLTRVTYFLRGMEEASHGGTI